MRRVGALLVLAATALADPIRVRVVTFPGEPVTGARLEVRRSQSGRYDIRWPEWEAERLEAMWKETPPGADDTLVATVTTGADGWAEIGALPDGAFDVTAHVPGLAIRGAQVLSPPVRGGPSPTILLDEGHTITGRVTGEDGLPVAGALVVAIVPSAGTARWQDEERPLVAVADEKGAFRIDGLPQGTAVLHACPPGTWFDRVHLLEVPREAPVEIVLPLYDLDVVVKDDRTDAPVADVPVFFSTFGFHMSNMVIRARTDAKGRVRMRAPNPYLGRGLVIARGSLGPLRHFAWDKSCNWRFAGKTVELRAPAAAPVRGLVRDATGPVADALVTATWLEGVETKSISARSGPEGAFEVRVPPGIIHLAAGWPCSAASEDESLGALLATGLDGERGILLVARGGRDGVPLALPARPGVGRVRARVVTADGAPVSTWPRVVGVKRRSWSGTAGDGTVEIDAIAAGEARLSVSVRGVGEVESAAIRVEEGKTTPLFDFVVPKEPTVHVEGRAIGHGRPLYVNGCRRFPVAPDGTFAFETTAFAGGVSVWAVDADGWTAHASAECKPGETVKFGDLQFEEPRFVDCRVVVAGTGAPVAGATASLYFPPDAIYCGNFEDPVDLGWRADKEGNLRYPIPKDDHFEVRIRAPGLTGRNLQRGSLGGDIELKPLGALAGRVRFADGRPAAGVRVEATTEWCKEVPHEEREAFTDAEGRFRIDGLLSAVHQVLVESGEAGPSIARLKQEVDVPLESLDLVVTSAPAIEGTVVDVRARPVADLTVRASRAGAPHEFETRTDQSGRFRLAGVGDGKYDIEVSHDGVYTYAKVRNVAAGKTLVVEAELGYRISGKVLDGEGRPRAGCVVYAAARSVGGFREVRTDVLGQFVLDDIEGGLWELQVHYGEGGKMVRAGTTDVVLTSR